MLQYSKRIFDLNIKLLPLQSTPTFNGTKNGKCETALKWNK